MTIGIFQINKYINRTIREDFVSAQVDATLNCILEIKGFKDYSASIMLTRRKTDAISVRVMVDVKNVKLN